jgi:Undecaprenyl-phosphate galactose phosphotransferase WbaP
LFGVVVGGLLVSPLLLAVVALIKSEASGPVFYKQLRPGTGGEYFNCFKFRTMYDNADVLLTEYLESNPDLRAEWERNRKLRDDPRITRTGRFLRRTSLDELPQLWNVLRGEMSLVGPRPMLTEEISTYGEVYELYKRMRPGMTGLWQVSGRNDLDYEERVTIVSYYVRNWSIWLDFVILARTVKTVVTGRGAN